MNLEYSMTRRTILFTDLDGTLLDEKTYSFEAALPAVGALQERGIPIVFCTSKTFLETVALQEEMGIMDPFIVENGGAIYYRPGQVTPVGIHADQVGEWRRISLGVPYRALVAQLQAIRQILGIQLTGYADMSEETIAAEDGMSLEGAKRARQREFDEPFRIEACGPEELERLERMILGIGLKLTQGGRYFHISGQSDKGRAVRMLCRFLKEPRFSIRAIGIGDSPNDLPMLEAVDDSIVVMRPGGAYHPALLERLSGAVLAQGVGPEGWNATVLDLLEGW